MITNEEIDKAAQAFAPSREDLRRGTERIAFSFGARWAISQPSEHPRNFVHKALFDQVSGDAKALQAKLDIQINATQILIDTVESYAKGHIGNMLALTKISEYEDALKQFNPVQSKSGG